MTCEQIARKLSISIETVKKRHQKIKRVLGAKTAAHEVALGIRAGLIG